MVDPYNLNRIGWTGGGDSSSFSSTDRTYITYPYTPTGDGYLNHIRISMGASGQVKLATFDRLTATATGYPHTCRDVVTLGQLPIGDDQDIYVDASDSPIMLEFKSGDYLGVCITSGAVKATSAYGGYILGATADVMTEGLTSVFALDTTAYLGVGAFGYTEGVFIGVDWDNDGYMSSSSEDLSNYIRSYNVKRGKDSNMGRAMVGTANVVIKDVGGKFIPSSTVSALTGYVIPGRNIRVTRTYKGTEYPLFQGRLDDIQNDYAQEIREAYFSCTDGSEQLSGISIDDNYEPSTGIDSGVAVSTALTYVGFSTFSTGQQVDTGDYTYGFVWPHNISVRTVMDAFEDSESGFFYLNRSGTPCWETADHRASHHSTSEWVCSGDIWRSLKTMNNWKDVTNKVVMKGAHKYQQTEYSTWAVWTCAEATTGSPFLLGPSSYRRFWADTVDVTGKQQHWINLAWRDTANSSSAGGGADVSSFIASSSYINYGDTIMFKVCNQTTSNAWVSSLYYLGMLWTDEGTTTITSESTTSQDIYGLKAKSYDLRWAPSSSDMQTIADARVAAASTARSTYIVEVVNNSSDALMHALDLDISDRFTLQDSRISLSRDVYIDQVQHNWSVMDGVHHTLWTVSCAT